ncbi:MAG: hypothetical protein ABR907_03045 [Terracidiphilus sp.]|jgi:hypothetical protein
MNQTASSPRPPQIPARIQAPPPSAIPSPYRAVQPKFEYTGKTALTVVSPLTGKSYRFAKPGEQLPVDDRDRQWIAFIPNLKRCG